MNFVVTAFDFRKVYDNHIKLYNLFGTYRIT